MSSVRKCILVPIEQWEYLKRKRQRHDNEGDEVTESHDSVARGNVSSGPDIVEDMGDNRADHSSMLSDEVIVVAMPRNYKNKAKALLEHIRAGDVLKWNEKGELIDESDEDRVISGSHITDLLKDLSLRDYSGDTPEGGEYFLKNIALQNIPLCLISNLHRRRVIRSIRRSQSLPDVTEEPPECKWIKF